MSMWFETDQKAIALKERQELARKVLENELARKAPKYREGARRGMETKRKAKQSGKR